MAAYLNIYCGVHGARWNIKTASCFEQKTGKNSLLKDNAVIIGKIAHLYLSERNKFALRSIIRVYHYPLTNKSIKVAK